METGDWKGWPKTKGSVIINYFKIIITYHNKWVSYIQGPANWVIVHHESWHSSIDGPKIPSGPKIHLWTNHWEQSASSTLSVSDICEVCKFALNGCSYEHAATDNNVWGLSIWRHHANSNNANVLGLQFKDSSNIIAILEYTPSLDLTNIVSLDVNALLWGPITQYGWHSDWACRTVINLMLS